MNIEHEIKRLSDCQREAVMKKDGPVLVLAGAGSRRRSGKRVFRENSGHRGNNR